MGKVLVAAPQGTLPVLTTSSHRPPPSRSHTKAPKLSSVPGGAHAKLHLEIAHGNAGLKLGLIQRGPFHGAHWEGARDNAGTHQAEPPSFPLGTRRKDGPSEILG